MPQLLIDTDTRLVTIPGPPSLWVPPDLHTTAIELLIETATEEGLHDRLERVLTALAYHTVEWSYETPPPGATVYDELLDVIAELHRTGSFRGLPQRPDGEGD